MNDSINLDNFGRMMNDSINFDNFGRVLWRVANTLRDDTLQATQYLEEFSYFFFLKLWDDREQTDEVQLKGLEEGDWYIPWIPEKYRFYNWSRRPTEWATQHGFRNELDFIHKLFEDLQTLGDVISVTTDYEAGRLDNKLKDVPEGQLDIRAEEYAGRYYFRCPPKSPDAHIFASEVSHFVDRDLSLHRKIFKDYAPRVRYASTVRALAERLRELELPADAEGRRTWDVLGRAYEFVVDKLGEQQQYGQYFTPRHIIQAMVEMAQPSLADSIYDPAFGTCGFLVIVYLQLQKQIGRLPYSEREAAWTRLKTRTIYGTEKAPDVFKLGLMNMVLHGDGNSNLQPDDSLQPKAQMDHKEAHTLILANPPFGPLAQERTDRAAFADYAKQYDLLFMQHIMQSLQEGGRAVVVIKEGFLFDGKRAYVNTRKRLVDDYDVQAVISLPSGVFNPYSGAKTSIIIFRKPRPGADTTKRVWCYDLRSDGRNLGATRQVLDPSRPDGDLPDMVARWRGHAEREGPKSWYADVAEIRAHQYNLTAGRYAPPEVQATSHIAPDELINRAIELEKSIVEDLEELLKLVD
ncbi:MAG TPA: N-6 DNA methylase [Chloroflexia bacterium]|jgi:type I restriction enzyme M protein